MSDERLTLRIALDPGDGAGDPERDDVVRAVRRDLLELDVDAVDRPAAAVPEGARAGEAFALGSLLVTLAPSALAAVTGVVQGWLARDKGRSMTLQLGEDRIELSGASEDEQRRLVEAFLERHQGG